MSIFLLFIGFIILVAAYKGTQPALFMLLKEDFTGSSNFFFWIAAIMLIIALGNIKPIKPITDAFLVLTCIGIVFAQYQGKNGQPGIDLLQSFLDQLKAGTSGTGSVVKNPPKATSAISTAIQNFESLAG